MGYPGIARFHIWSPKFDADIKLYVKNYDMCQDSANMSLTSGLRQWECQGRPWF